MIIRDAGDGLLLDDGDNFGELKLRLSQSPAVAVHDLPDHVKHLGVWDGPGHVYVHADTLRKLAGPRAESVQWEKNFIGMVEYARKAGWVDGAGRVRVHADYTGRPPAISNRDDYAMPNWSGDYVDMNVDISLQGRVRVFDLAVKLEMGMARHPSHPPYAFAMAKTHGGHGYKDGVSAAMEMISMGAHVGTHMDALGHVSKDGKVYGDRAVAMGCEGIAGLDAGSIEESIPMIGRGHLFNGPEFFGRDLTPADALGPDVFESWFADKPAPSPGSIVLIRTGWMKYWDDPDRYIGLSTGLPGVTIEGARWLSDRGIVATGSDTMNYEHKPDSTVINLPVHVHNLVKCGIPIMESMNLEALGNAEVTDFTFIAIPLRIGGGTGSPLRPIAIVQP